MTALGSGPGAKPATAARIYDYLLGGTHNFPADREAANSLVRMFPHTPQAAQLNRAFLRRVVRHLSGLGVRQFLDIGSGIPTEGNVHEIAQELAPDTRVVYVDIDPVAVGESQELLQGNAFATAIQGDVRDPKAILNHAQVRRLIDFDMPVAVLMVALLHFMSDDAEANAAVRAVLDAVSPGSFLVVSHVVDETPEDDETGERARLREVYKRQTAALLRLRTMAEITQFFDGLELVEPGVVWVSDWRPEAGEDRPADDDLVRYVTVGGVGRLP